MSDPADVTFNGDGSDMMQRVNMDAAGSGANYLKYDYTATGTEVTATFQLVSAPGQHWALAAATNEGGVAAPFQLRIAASTTTPGTFDSQTLP